MSYDSNNDEEQNSDTENYNYTDNAYGMKRIEDNDPEDDESI